VNWYRDVRQEYMREYCRLLHGRHGSFRRVIGTPTDVGDEPYRTFDVVVLEGDQWTAEMEQLLLAIERDLGVTGRATIHRITDELASKVPPSSLKSNRRARRPTDGRVGRNDPCPCQSNKKFKHCCLPKLRDG
jgi:hypothetical protein